MGGDIDGFFGRFLLFGRRRFVIIVGLVGLGIGIGDGFGSSFCAGEFIPLVVFLEGELSPLGASAGEGVGFSIRAELAGALSDIEVVARGSTLGFDWLFDIVVVFGSILGSKVEVELVVEVEVDLFWLHIAELGLDVVEESETFLLDESANIEEEVIHF